MLIAAYKIAPALLMGNTVVLKPAPTTPVASLQLGAMAADIFPAGVLNVITDRNDSGSLLTSHPDVAKVSFTGSTATGKKVMESAGPRLKRITLELGGNDGAIVLDDADVAEVARASSAAPSTTAGRSAWRSSACTCTPRSTTACARRWPSWPAGRWWATAPMPVSPSARCRTPCSSTRRAAFSPRARWPHPRRRGAAQGGGYFVAPTIVRDLPDHNALVAEEQFAPILPVLKYEQIDEAVARVNASPYGLGGSVWSASEDRASEVARRLDVGTAWVNHHLHFGPHIPLVGAKESGIGVEFGTEGLAEFAQLSVLNIAHRRSAEPAARTHVRTRARARRRACAAAAARRPRQRKEERNGGNMKPGQTTPGRLRRRLRAVATSAAVALACAAMPAHAIDVDAGDYTALPAGTNLGLLYYQHAERDKVYAGGTQVAGGRLNSDIGILRYVHFMDIGGFTVDPQILLPFGGLRGSKDLSALGSGAGVADPIPAATVWLLNQPEQKRYFGITPSSMCRSAATTRAGR